MKVMSVELTPVTGTEVNVAAVFAIITVVVIGTTQTGHSTQA